VPLVEKEHGETKGFFCRYHGWTYDLGGRLTAVREKRDFPGMGTSCFGFNEVRCEQFGNFVFINEDPQAAPLLQSLGPIPRHLENLGFDSIRHIASSSFEIACNVKILLDAFLARGQPGGGPSAGGAAVRTCRHRRIPVSSQLVPVRGIARGHTCRQGCS